MGKARKSSQVSQQTAVQLSLSRILLGEFIQAAEKKNLMVIVSVSAVLSFVAFELCLETNTFLLYFPLGTVRRSAFRWFNEKQASVDSI